MTALAGHVPVPPSLAHRERITSVLGAPFFMMRRVHGRIPGDVPCWHQKGWTVELAPADRTRLHDGALAELVAPPRRRHDGARVRFPGDRRHRNGTRGAM